VRRTLAIICYLALLYFGIAFSRSTVGLLLFGVGPVLLWDRYAFRCLRWPTPTIWASELFLRATYFVTGGVAAYCVRLGLVPIREAVLVGASLSVGAFLFECLCQVVFRNVRLSSRARIGCSAGTFVALLALVAPLEAIHPLRTVPKRDPEVVGLAFEDVHFTTADGMKLTGWLVPHPDARGNVIFCHGHGRNREQGTGFLQTFHELGLNALAFDFRGHGDSDGHTATFGSREIQDLVAAEEFLSCRFPGKPVFLVGVSYGAAVALQSLPQLPRVQAVWCEGCFGRFLPVVENQFVRLPVGLRRSLASTYQALARLDCGLRASDINPIEGLDKIRIPIYFCHGENDDLVPFSEGKQLYDHYAGPKHHYWVAGAGHYDVRRRNKEEYLLRLRTFLAEALTTTSSRFSE
jgi:alpha-beta hydrolase superfamily lysophospholipase